MTLVIMAAGLGSRFGGVKQLAHVGPNGETIMELTIADAVRAGFNHIVIILRREIYNDYYETVGRRLLASLGRVGVTLAIAFQEPVQGRQKPMGTGHAIMSCKGIVREAFAVINADDYYGEKAMEKAAAFLEDSTGYGLIAYRLSDTLSGTGGVTRGLLDIWEGQLVGIYETRNIIQTDEGPEVKGKKIHPCSLVSMNFWIFPEGFIDVLCAGYESFVKSMEDPKQDEYTLPVIVDGLIKQGLDVSVINANDRWFGVTYRDDVDIFRQFTPPRGYMGGFKEGV